MNELFNGENRTLLIALVVIVVASGGGGTLGASLFQHTCDCSAVAATIEKVQADQQKLAGQLAELRAEVRAISRSCPLTYSPTPAAKDEAAATP